MNSSPTLGELTLPASPPPLVSFLLLTLRLHRHLKLAKGKSVSLTLSGSSSAPLTDYYTVLLALQKTFDSSIEVAPRSVQAAQIGSIDSKPLSAKELKSIIESLSSDDGNGRSFVNATSSPSLGDFNLYFSLTASKTTPSGQFFDRWLACMTSNVQDALSSPVGFTDELFIGKVKALCLAPTAAANSPAFLNLDPASSESSKTIASGKGQEASAAAAASSKGQGERPKGGAMSEEEKKVAREKREKAKAEKAAKKSKESAKAPVAAGASSDPTVGALDIRVGKLLKVWEHPEADKLFCEDIDLGPELGVRQIASGLRPFYKKEDMEGKLVMVLCNLKKRNLVGFPSHGMVMCSSSEDHTAVQLVIPAEGSALGERVICEGFDTPPEPENKIAKKKIFEKVAPDLVTDDDGVATYKGVKFTTSKGPCVAEKKMKGGHVS